MAKTHVELIAAERVVYSDDADLVLAPGAEGQLGILPRHAPLLALLVPGDVIIRNGGEETVMAIGGGFVEASPHRVVILADSAERAEEIDVGRAEAAMRRARAYLAERRPETDVAAAEAALARATARLRAVEIARRRRGAPTPRQSEMPE